MLLHPPPACTPNLIYPLNAVIPPPSTVSLLLRKEYVVILPTFHHPLPRISSCALSKTKSKNQSYIDKYESKFSSGLSSRREEGTKKEKREREKRGVFRVNSGMLRLAMIASKRYQKCSLIS